MPRRRPRTTDPSRAAAATVPPPVMAASSAPAPALAPAATALNTLPPPLPPANLDEEEDEGEDVDPSAEADHTEVQDGGSAVAPKRRRKEIRGAVGQERGRSGPDGHAAGGDDRDAEEEDESESSSESLVRDVRTAVLDVVASRIESSFLKERLQEEEEKGRGEGGDSRRGCMNWLTHAAGEAVHVVGSDQPWLTSSMLLRHISERSRGRGRSGATRAESSPRRMGGRKRDGDRDEADNAASGTGKPKAKRSRRGGRRSSAGVVTDPKATAVAASGFSPLPPRGGEFSYGFQYPTTEESDRSRVDLARDHAALEYHTHHHHGGRRNVKKNAKNLDTLIREAKLRYAVPDEVEIKPSSILTRIKRGNLVAPSGVSASVTSGVRRSPMEAVEEELIRLVNAKIHGMNRPLTPSEGIELANGLVTKYGMGSGLIEWKKRNMYVEFDDGGNLVDPETAGRVTNRYWEEFTRRHGHRLFVVSEKMPRPNPMIAELSPHPRSLHLLWQEYIYGVGGRKPARDFTSSERGRSKHRYCRRKLVWDTIERLIGAGCSEATAIDRIYECYGRDMNVTEISNAIRRDNKTGGHPDLRVHDV